MSAATRNEGWRPASEPPESSSPELWSRPVVVVTNAGRVYRLSYFPGGRWQRPKDMETGEQPMWWAELPHEQ